MNGLTSLETDYLEFVEVDPTGRYRRVNIHLRIPSFLHVVINIWSFESHINVFSLCFLQYNEILGKGASKTVYGCFLFWVLICGWFSI